ncbi:hypothetical protein LTR56_027724 [Elasticomyces elasticus]|nr:hypothetical protein LTR56_027724 [Elasticomyces elasticus]KAK3613707.1 hypothetical protein LTR22_028047 [Elasticomyces elasticus]
MLGAPVEGNWSDSGHGRRKRGNGNGEDNATMEKDWTFALRVKTTLQEQEKTRIAEL